MCLIYFLFPCVRVINWSTWIYCGFKEFLKLIEKLVDLLLEFNNDGHIFILLLIDNGWEYIYNNCTNGTAQLHITIEKLLKIKIKVPKNKQLITDLEPKFQEIEQCQENVKTFEQQYEQKLKDLYQAAVKEINIF